ncbi:MAG: molecular chaperone TorD family protein [Candidatus Thiosymbion ectosymbiont of Robbea hypermnestra]|nr:molecular chaperone TorD family protein [Candidatus Thiosymbion ectosymbiont of Robbea hypermnestra]
MSFPSADPNRLRILAALLAMPEDDALDALRDMLPAAPWLEPSLPELARIPLTHWQAEYTRLFISAYPRTPCPPYESAYRQGIMDGPPTTELADLYRRAGLQALDLPADYLGTMLECAAYLKEQGLDGLLRELTEEHLGLWLPRFARDLCDQAELALYRALGEQLGALIPEPPDHA